MGQVASSKQTGAGGITYEDKVNALFMACLLSETPPFRPSLGMLSKIKLQVRSDGWLFDDALLYLATAGEEKRIAVSIKSALHITSNGIHPEINEALWQQYLKDISNVFNPATDLLCLVEPKLPAALAKELNTLLAQAAVQEKGDLLTRLNVTGFGSDSRRKIYESFICPAALAEKHPVPTDKTDDLLKHFVHQEMDFDMLDGDAEKLAIGLCRNCLKDKQYHSAKGLFERLCQLPRALSPQGGYIDKAGLLVYLRNHFELLDFPSHSNDWKKIEAHTKAKLDIIVDNIGSQVNFLRNYLIDNIQEHLVTHRAVIVHGISGAGKTVIAKNLALQKMPIAKIIWFDHNDFNQKPETTLGLHHSLSELLTDSTAPIGFVFIDGVEKLYTDTQQQQLTLLISAVLKQPDSPWKIIVTVPSENLGWLLQLLYRCKLSTELFSPIPIPGLNDEEVRSLLLSFPALSFWLLKRKQRLLLNNLKLLDKVLFHISALSEGNDYDLAETLLIDFIWIEEIQGSNNGVQKATFIKLLSEIQADKLTLSVGANYFTVPEMLPADELVKSNFIDYSNEHFSFKHDLYGDWARYRLLLSHAAHIETFLQTKHLSSPLWIRSLRYYGISLLEKEKTAEKWKETFLLFNTVSSQNTIIQDVLLEALFFANNAIDYLTKYKSFLFENDGKPLQRLLRLFLIRATTPNPSVLTRAKEGGYSEAIAVEINRLPLYIYWVDMLQFIDLYLDEFLHFDRNAVIEVVHTWLQHTPDGFYMRKQASKIACSAAKRSSKLYLKDEKEKMLYESVMLGFKDNTEEVRRICLELSQRIETPTPAVQTENDPSLLTVHAPASIKSFLAHLSSPAVKWVDGPYRSVPYKFQTSVLETAAIYEILSGDSALGTEILLAILIDEPHERQLGNQDRSSFCLFEPIGWYPPFYNRGPFLNYFRINPTEALQFTLTIVDFATERYLEQLQHKGLVDDSITIVYVGGKKVFKGDRQVFGWHKDMGNPPHSLVTILMAFEQFLYEELDNKKPVDAYVRQALDNTNSLAIVGLLLVVAKKEWTLFKNVLQPLLPTFRFYVWDLHSTSHEHIYSYWDLPKSWQSMAEEWTGRKHRFIPLKDILVNYFLLDVDLQKIYEPITDQWEAELNEIKKQEQIDIYLLQIIPQFRMENWVRDRNDQPDVQYKEPEEVSAVLKDARTSSLTTMSDNNFAYNCDQLIKQKSLLTEEEITFIWNKLNDFVLKLDQQDADELSEWSGWASPYTNIMAAMAVLMNFSSYWIIRYPDYCYFIKEFCHTLIDKELVKETVFDRPGTDHDWNIFLGMVAVQLWMMDRYEPISRKILAGVCVQFNAATIRIVFTEIAKQLEWQHPDFIQLQNFVLETSAAFQQYYDDRRDIPVSIVAVKKKLIESFSGDTIVKTPGDWADFRVADRKKPKTSGYRRRLLSDEDDYARQPGLYPNILTHLIASLPFINKARSPEERNHILLIIRQAIHQLVFELGDIKASSVAIESYPDEFHLKVIRTVAVNLAMITEDEHPELYWQPIFNYGYIAQRIIEIFCNHFYLKNITEAERYPAMIKLIEAMMVFAAGSTTWKAEHISRGEDFRVAIMGMSPQIVSIWTDDYTAFMTLAKAHYVKWFTKHRINPYSVSALLDVVVSRSGDIFVADALPIFKFFFGLSQARAELPANDKFIFVGVPEHNSKLAKALNYIWNNKKSVLQTNDGLFNIFRDLVQYLVALKNTAAIELQNELLIQ